MTIPKMASYLQEEFEEFIFYFLNAIRQNSFNINSDGKSWIIERKMPHSMMKPFDFIGFSRMGPF